VFRAFRGLLEKPNQEIHETHEDDQRVVQPSAYDNSLGERATKRFGIPVVEIASGPIGTGRTKLVCVDRIRNSEHWQARGLSSLNSGR
jgi:hypothetical protein